jgi:hypothetical protein
MIRMTGLDIRKFTRETQREETENLNRQGAKATKEEGLVKGD